MTAGTVHPVADEALGNTASLIEAGRGLAVVIDPRRDIQTYQQHASALGVRIAASLETHLHADFISGGRELAAACDAEVVAPADADLTVPHLPMRDGDEYRIGDITLRAIATPGHTPEHLAYLLEVGGAMRGVFTGGALIAGGAARTDLIAPERIEELGRALNGSMARLAALPDDIEVYPTHGGGSFCAAGAGGPAGTVADQRRANPLLQAATEDEFLELLFAGYGTHPPYFLRLREVNRAGAPLVHELAKPQELPPSEALDLVERGAWLIDGRPTQAWASMHPRGAVSIEIRPAFASWLGWVVPFAEPIVLLADDGARRDALTLAHRIGYDRILGFIDGGMDAWIRAGLPTETAEQIAAAEARVRIHRGAVLLDVRQRSERHRARVPGSVHLELGDIIAGKIPDADEVVAFCGHGERSATAVSLLERRGLRAANLDGGLEGWRAAGLPVER